MRVIHRRARLLLGTLVDVQVGGSEAGAVATAALDEVTAVHALLIFHVRGNGLQVINRAVPGKRLIVDSQTFAVLCPTAELHIVSERAFDCHASLSDLFAGRWSPTSFDGDIIVKETCAYMDLGSIVKGFAVGCAIEVLHIFAVERAIVNAGGGLHHHGARSMSVQVCDPQDAVRTATSVLLSNAALANSMVDGSDAAVGGVSHTRDARGRLSPPFVGAMVQAPTRMPVDALAKIVPVTNDATYLLLRRYGGIVVVRLRV